MNKPHILSAISLFLVLYSPFIVAQQPYIRQVSASCSQADNSTSASGYSCNGVNRNCQAYLTFSAVSPFNSVSTIATLLNVNSSRLSQLNEVPENTIFESNRTVLVPIDCSCSGQYYQSNTPYVVRNGDLILSIANDVFQGLSTCQSILAQNNIVPSNLHEGDRISVPLRCACPTKSQIDNRFKYLLTYLIMTGEFVFSISSRFGVDTGSTLAANELSEQDSTIYPLTTLLVPLQNPPTSSQITAPQPPPPPITRPADIPPPSDGKSKSWVYAVVGVIGGIAVACAVGVCVFFSKRKKKSDTFVSSEKFKSVEKPLNKKVEDQESQDFLESISSIAQSLKVYSFDEVRDATDDFSPNCLVKGSVYRGTINGDFAAVKKMNGDVSKEISLLNKINHFNLIRLSGVCFNEGSWYLIYEYAWNGPLSDWIHTDERKVLSWNQRLQIAMDIATGLNYLHHFTSPPHIHKDLNSNNVLLDRDLRAKIANFGLARSAEGQEGEFVLTRHIVGTKGYMAPEYLENGLVSPKLDIYAFGILMLEILTGKEVPMLYEEGHGQLSDVIAPVLHQENGQENLKRVMDPLLQGNYPPELAILLFRLIDDCIKKDPSDRPSTDDIFQSLSRISTALVSGEWAISASEHRTMPR